MGSVTFWIGQVKRGDPLAAERLWERYFEKLVRVAQRRLGRGPPGVGDEEDVALVAFTAFCRAAKEGRFPNLADRDSLWRLLLWITARRATDQLRKNWGDHQHVKREAALPSWDSPAGVQALGEVLGDEPSPEVIFASTEKCRELLERLGDTSLQEIAIAKLEGYKDKEIAHRMGLGLRTVERKIHLIRELWKRELDPRDPQSSESD
jgi:DNA-directed RNA polymerase specialized sigma24 family protein